jgi:hypothetical protein
MTFDENEGSPAAALASDPAFAEALAFIAERAAQSGGLDQRRATIEAAEAWHLRALCARRALADGALKQLAAIEAASRHPDGEAAGAAAILSEAPRRWPGGASFGALRIEIFEDLCRYLHSAQRRAGPRGVPHDMSDIDLIRDLVGDRPGDGATSVMAAAWRETIARARALRRDACNQRHSRTPALLPVRWDARRISAFPAEFAADLRDAVERGSIRLFESDTGLEAGRRGIDDYAGAIAMAADPAVPFVRRHSVEWRSAGLWHYFHRRWGEASDSIFGKLIGHLDEIARELSLLRLFGQEPDGAWRSLMALAAVGPAGGGATPPEELEQACADRFVFQDMACLHLPDAWRKLEIEPSSGDPIPDRIAAAMARAGLEAFRRIRRCELDTLAERFPRGSLERLLLEPTERMMQAATAAEGGIAESGVDSALALARAIHQAAADGIARGWRTAEIAANLFIALTLIGTQSVRRSASPERSAASAANDPDFWPGAARRGGAFLMLAELLGPHGDAAPDRDGEPGAIGRKVARLLRRNRPGSPPWYRRIAMDRLISRHVLALAAPKRASGND